MKQLPEKSPLYGRRFSEKDRREIQINNRQVILTAMAKYNINTCEPKIELDGLNVNGVFVQDASLEVTYDHKLFSADIMYNKKPISNRRFQMSIDTVEDTNQEISRIRLIDHSRLSTAEAYEGNGFGMAMLIATEGIIPKLIATLPSPSRVIAHHVDGARGAEQDTADMMGYRFGWTGNMLHTLGYSNDQVMIKDCIGREAFNLFRIPQAHWIKLFRA